MSLKTNKTITASPTDWLTGGGEMGKLIREMDWSKTPLGPIRSWPQSLKTTVRLMLNSRYPMFLGWGRKLIFFYNDAYIPALGSRHPAALGQPASRIWPEIWDVVGPQTEIVMREGRATWNESVLLVMGRYGYTEETYFTFSYSPAMDDDGKVGGVFCACIEDTKRVLGERRLRTLRALAEKATQARSAEEACAVAAATMRDNPYDLPFAMLYLLDADGAKARLAGATMSDMAAAPALIELRSGTDGVWPLRQVIESGESQIVNNLDVKFGRDVKLPGGAWPEPARQAVVLPMARLGQERPSGFLIAGVSPRLLLDDDYHGFLEMAAGHVATAVANARAYEEERRRAEALAELDRAKTAFFSNVSHEFRTPLTLMLGPLEDALAEDGLPPQTQERLEMARRNSLRLLKLVNTLLDFSRIEAGRIQAVYEPVDLAALTADLAGVFRSAIERAGMTLTVDCPPLGQHVYVDREMWEKIVLNLISNAFKFTLEGEIEVRLRIEESAGGERPTSPAAILTVRDTGAGIPGEELPHVFERFHRVRGVSGRSHEGSGIGLALVQELVKLHGGTVRVESEVGRGSSFIVSIPLGKDHLPADRIGAARALASTASGGEAYVEEALRWLPETRNAEYGMRNGERSVGHTLETDDVQDIPHSAFRIPRSRILLADDNADMREYLRRLLSGPHEVMAVADGQAALEAARERAFDLILTDVMMPRLDGFGLLRELRADERTREIPVIVLSARAGEESKVEGLEAGANDYLVKPFSARELLALVEARLQFQRARRESQEALRASERKFSTAFDQSPLALTITSLDDGRLVDVNESFTRLSGYTREEAVGRTPDELKLWVEPERRAEGLERLRAGERINNFEARFRTKSGEERVGVMGSALIEINSRPHALSSVTDITERKRAEEALGRLAAIVESSDDAIIGKDLNGVITSWNKGAERLFGYAAEEIIGKSIMAIIPPDRADEETRVLESIRRGEKIDHYETVRRAKDGSLVKISLSVSPIKDEAGKVIGASKIARDITERKRAEEALAEGARRQGALYQLADQLHRAQSLDEVYSAALDAILGALRCDRASILLFDGAGVMRFVGWRGLSDDYRKAVEGHSPWTPDERNPAPIGVGDIDAADISDSLKAVIKGEGIGALAFIPLVSSGKLIGKFMTYFNAPHAFSDDELRLSLTIARQLAFGIDRKRAEELLRQTATQLALITDTAPVFIAQCDSQARFKFVNKAYAQRFGLTPTDCIGKHISEFIGEEAYESLRPYIEIVLRGEPVEFELEVPYVAIGKHFMHCSYAPEFDADGNVVGWVSALTDISERKRAEEALRESEARFRHLADAMPQLVWAADGDGAVTYYNSRAAQYAGLERRPDGTWAWQPMLHPDDLQPTIAAWRKALETGLTYECEHRIRTADGSFRWHLSRGVPARDERGAVKWFGTATDIHEQKMLEERIRESEKRFRQMADNAPVMVRVTEADMTCSYLSKSWYEFSGQTPETGLGFGWLDAAHPDDRERVERAFREANAEREAFRSEYRLRRKDGEYRWMIDTASPRLGSGGEFLGYIGSVIDITDRKRQEEQIARLLAEEQRHAERLRKLNEASVAINAAVSVEEILRLTNEKARELTGARMAVINLVPDGDWSRAQTVASLSDEYEAWRDYDAQMTGEGIYRLVFDEKRTMRMRQAELEAHPAWRGYGREAGKHPPLRGWLAAPLCDGADLSIGVVQLSDKWVDGKADEFTEADEALLRQLAQVAAVALENQQLYQQEQQAREAAEQATRAKDEFLAVVSHELRSPLNAILGWNRLLRSQRSDDTQIVKVTETVERSGKAQLQLIEDLLDTARIITGKMKLEFQPVEPVAVITAALDTVRPAADSKGVIVTTDLDPKAGQITGDPDRLQQVVWNLVSNAIKFTPGGGRVWVELRRGGAGVQIVVRDTGQGISPDLLPYIFDRFKQGDSTTSRRFGGLGLGLALVKHLTELHGGGVTVESPGEGQGSTFIVNLPVRAVKGDSGAEGQRDSGAALDQFTRRRPASARLEGLRALVVDDEAGARELLTATLELHGVSVTSADSADAALAALESQFEDGADAPFDILISDIGMPVADGYELMRRVRALPDERVNRIHAIALTAYARSEDRLRALQAGFQMHVPKPVDEEELTTVIASLTGRISGGY